jgi:hypothetical protein
VADPVTAGTYTVTAAFAGSANYAPASATALLTIDRATTSFGSLDSPTVTYGTTSITLSGKIVSTTIVPAGNVVITILGGGLAQPLNLSAQVGTDGRFSAGLPPRFLAAGRYAISYTSAGSANFTPAAGSGTLTVAYATRLLFDNTRPVHRKRVLDVRLQVTDASGNNLSSQPLPLKVTALVGPQGQPVPVKAKGPANPGNLFQYEGGRRSYTFHLDLSGLAAGSYTLSFTAGNDPTQHAVRFVVK